MTTTPETIDPPETVAPREKLVDDDIWGDGRRTSMTPWIRIGVIGGGLVLLLLVSTFAPLPHSVTIPDPTAILSGPDGNHWFGTDPSGLDVFSRTIAAAHYDLLVALGAALISTVVGTALGLFAGLRSRWADLFMRGVDAFQALPLLIVILAVMALSGGGTLVLVVTIALANLATCIRLVRAESLHVRESFFVGYCSVIGVPKLVVLLRHILPNVAGIVVVQASLSAATNIRVLAALSFLGYGVAPPNPSWGSMIQDGASAISSGVWWPVVFPAAALVGCVIALNVIADNLDSILARESS